MSKEQGSWKLLLTECKCGMDPRSRTNQGWAGQFHPVLSVFSQKDYTICNSLNYLFEFSEGFYGTF